MNIKKYNKLVRDKIPNIIESTGNKAIIEYLDYTKYKSYLNKKLNEELNEYIETGDIEELVDIVEVIYSIIETNNCSFDEFEQKRLNKKIERGGFKNKILLKKIIEK